MRWMWAVLFLMVIACVPATAATPEEDLLAGVRNISVTVPPTMSAVLGTQESMTGYSGWLNNCAEAAMSLVNQVLKVFGQEPLAWSTASVKNGGSDAVDISSTSVSPDLGLVTIATITGSESQGQAVTIPKGAFWMIRYTADPLATGGQGTTPALSIWIYDAKNGRDLDRVEPPGGLDPAAWARNGDPRPWAKQFMQGNGRVLFFEVTATSLKSYTIEVLALPDS